MWNVDPPRTMAGPAAYRARDTGLEKFGLIKKVIKKLAISRQRLSKGFVCCCVPTLMRLQGLRRKQTATKRVARWNASRLQRTYSHVLCGCNSLPPPSPVATLASLVGIKLLATETPRKRFG